MPFKKQLEAMYQAFRASGIECKWNESLASHTTFHIGGQAALAVWPASRAQLIQVLSFWRELGEKCPLCILGKGSNVLIPDSGYGGLVVITTRAKRVVFEEDECPDREAFRQEHVYCQVYAECGASLTGFLKYIHAPAVAAVRIMIVIRYFINFFIIFLLLNMCLKNIFTKYFLYIDYTGDLCYNQCI